MNDPTRVSLIERVAANRDDDASWQEFDELYRPLLTQFVKSKDIVAGSENVDDVVQQILINLAKRLPDFKLDHSKGKFRTYLWKIAHHESVNWLRKQGRHKQTVEIDRESYLQELEYQSQCDPDADFVLQVRRNAFSKALQKIKETANKQTWQCFERHILDRVPAAKVAEQLGISSNSVFVNASRIKNKVKAKCAEYMESLDDE